MELRCGPFRILYENGFLRHIRYGNSEILRMIYFALRDENWGTYGLDIANEKIVSEEDRFSIHYQAVNYAQDEPLIEWEVSIEGNPDGEIAFTIDGEVARTHKKNRAGFCVLHPLRETIDQPVTILHDNGIQTESTFPKFIEPDDPFTEIRELRWRVNDNAYILRFEGDIFETEDQRNWSDASFKTFCTPLRLPFPVQLKPGDKIQQRIIFSSDEQLPLKPHDDTVSLSFTEEELNLPEVGIGSSPLEEFTESIFNVIKSAGLSHYRVDVDLTGIEWQDSFNNDVLVAQRLQLPIEIAMQLPAHPEETLRNFLSIYQKEKVPVKKISLLSKGKPATTQEHLHCIQILNDYFKNIPIGAGTDFNFTELNRHRFVPLSVGYITFGLDPQEHATDDLTIVENLEAQYYGVISARNLYDLPVHVSPVLLKRKYNPYATDPLAFHIPDEQRRDERQRTPFCATWTLGSIKSLAEAGASSVTYFQAIGPHGLVSEEGEAYPVYEALSMLLNEKGSYRKTHSSAPHRADGLALTGNRMMVWNYTSEEREIRITNIGKTVLLSGYEIKILVMGD